MKILVVRFSSIGDIVLTTPVVGAIARQLDQVVIHYLTKKQFEPLLVAHPKIQKVHSFEKSLSEVIDTIKEERYDLLIDLHNNLRTFLLKRKIQIAHRSFRKLNIQKWLLVHFHYRGMPNLHVVDRYFETVHHIGVINDFRSCELFLSKEEIVDIQLRWRISPKTYLAVAIGAQFATKMMPVALLVDILSAIECPIILLGGVHDRERSLQIVEGLIDRRHPIVNAVDKLSLMESASVVAQAGVLLTHDTGLMHIATAFDVPIVSVWGNTVPDLGMVPYYPKNAERYSIHEVEKLSCRPCSKIGHARCPKKHFHCMTMQNVAAIRSAIQQKMHRDVRVESSTTD